MRVRAIPLRVMGMFARGLAIGFAIAAPVGPIGVLCIRRSVASGRTIGLATGLGAATADAFYGAVAAFGLTAISDVLISRSDVLRLVGGAVLVALGARTMLARPPERTEQAEVSRKSVASAYLSTIGLTLTNPTTILSFVAVFAGLGLVVGEGFARASILVVGVFVGSALWWLLLSGVASAFRARLGVRALTLVNRVSGGVVAGFGVAAMLSAL